MSKSGNEMPVASGVDTELCRSLNGKPENDEMRGTFLALEDMAQARIEVGGSPVFGKIIAHVFACLSALDAIDEMREKDPE